MNSMKDNGTEEDHVKNHVREKPFSRLPLLICITIKSSIDVRQFQAILQF